MTESNITTFLKRSLDHTKIPNKNVDYSSNYGNHITLIFKKNVNRGSSSEQRIRRSVSFADWKLRESQLQLIFLVTCTQKWITKVIMCKSTLSYQYNALKIVHICNMDRKWLKRSKAYIGCNLEIGKFSHTCHWMCTCNFMVIFRKHCLINEDGS